MELIHRAPTTHEWWREGVIYQVYPRSFASSNGATGDLPGITAHLGYLASLGIDAIWLSPFYVSPQHDAGYDVADYRHVDPIFGTDDDAAELIARAHERDLRVIVDLVPNHTSDQHAWFQAALASPDAPERDRYWFRESGDTPPTDWLSIFGGSAWTRVKDRPDAPGNPWEDDSSWYLHLFDSSQPDLNWDNEAVREEFRSILRYWLDLGADGFRVDVAHALVKDPALPDWQFHWDMVSGGDEVPENVPHPPMWDLPGVHEIYRDWRKVLNVYPDRAMVAEAWVDNTIQNYVRADEMNQSFNFDFLSSAFEAEAYREVIRKSLANMDEVGAPTTWVLSNHDVVRATSRFGLNNTAKGPNGIRKGDPQPDAVLGRRRALAAHALQAALPGSLYLYQGEELALPEHTTLDDSFRQDPAFFRNGGAEAGRDGCRIPLPWDSTAPGFGFSPTGETWLPQPAEWAELAVDVQGENPNSPLNFFRHMYRMRKDLKLPRRDLFEVESAGLHYVARLAGESDIHILTAFDESLELPRGEVILASSRLGEKGSDGGQLLPPNTTAWVEVE